MTVRVQEPKRPVSSFVRPLLKQAFHSSRLPRVVLGSSKGPCHCLVLSDLGRTASWSRWIMHAGQDKEHILKLKPPCLPHDNVLLLQFKWITKLLSTAHQKFVRHVQFGSIWWLYFKETNFEKQIPKLLSWVPDSLPKPWRDSQFSIASWSSIRSRGDKASWIGHGWWFCVASLHLVSKNIRI